MALGNMDFKWYNKIKLNLWRYTFMRKNFGPKTWLYPMPVLLISTYDKEGKPNIMNAAWGGIHDHNEIGLCLSRKHKTVQNILDNGAFTVSIADKEHLVQADYVGIVSGNNETDKVVKSGFHMVKSDKVNAPIIDDLAMVLECEFKSYDEESGYLVGSIVNVAVDESVLGENNLPDLDKFSPLMYDCATLEYRAMGEVVGQSFSDGKKLK